ncbi:MAG: hypothetical protein M3O02_00525 [Acidobacteriota bacterium]|nr:hypothetical protein [Acidobacteriota bacterium]
MSSAITIAAIRSGTDPLAPLPEGSFHRWLEMPLGCPKCHVTYSLVVPWDEATGRWFDQESRGPIRMLSKAIHMGHSTGHRVSHFETSGVIVKSFTGPGGTQ